MSRLRRLVDRLDRPRGSLPLGAAILLVSWSAVLLDRGEVLPGLLLGWAGLCGVDVAVRRLREPEAMVPRDRSEEE